MFSHSMRRIDSSPVTNRLPEHDRTPCAHKGPDHLVPIHPTAPPIPHPLSRGPVAVGIGRSQPSEASLDRWRRRRGRGTALPASEPEVEGAQVPYTTHRFTPASINRATNPSRGSVPVFPRVPQREPPGAPNSAVARAWRARMRLISLCRRASADARVGPSGAPSPS